VITWLHLAQSDASPAAPWLDSLGPFVAFGGLALLVIWWQQRQILEERKASREQTDRLIEMAERHLPLLETTNHALEENRRALDDARRAIDRQHRRTS
jgi:hypothetical protein